MMKNHIMKFSSGTRFVFVQNGFLDGVNFGGNCKYFCSNFHSVHATKSGIDLFLSF